MNRAEAQRLALDLMAEWELTQQGWTFGWIRATRTLGRCYHDRRHIVLSQSFVDLNERDKIEETIRHEIAHAIVGAGKGHGWEWQSMARTVGCKDPRAKCMDDDLKMARGRYVAVCSSCGHEFSRHRAPKPGRPLACSKHGRRFDPAYELTFVDTRASLAPTPQTPVRAPVSASQSAPSVDVQTQSASARVGATELAAAMKIQPKALRAWLRRRKDLQAKYQNAMGQYEFDAAAVGEIVREWNASH